MATTKELLEKAMLRLGSRGSRSDGVSVNFVPDQTTTEFQSFTAPQDGFCEASGIATLDSGMIWMDDRRGCRYAIRALWNGGSLAFSFPVRKGDSFMCQFLNMSTRSVNFIKSVGGGLRLLAETLGRSGGELWLRLRVFSKLQLLRCRCGNLLRSGQGSTSPRQYPTQNGANRLTTIRHRMGSLFTELRCVRTHSSEETVRACRNGGFLFKTQTEETKSFLCRRGKECLSGVVALIQTPLTHTFRAQPSILSHDCLAIEGGI